MSLGSCRTPEERHSFTSPIARNAPKPTGKVSTPYVIKSRGEARSTHEASISKMEKRINRCNRKIRKKKSKSVSLTGRKVTTFLKKIMDTCESGLKHRNKF